jgi:two-component system cell cycle sensor histidine kinase/response regulator CckA
MPKSLVFLSGTISGDVRMVASDSGEVSEARFSLACEGGLFYVRAFDPGQIYRCQALRNGDQVTVFGGFHSFVYKRCQSHHVWVNARAVMLSNDEAAIDALTVQLPVLKLWREGWPEATAIVQSIAGDSLAQQLLREHEERSAYASQVTATQTYTIYLTGWESLRSSWLRGVITLVGVSPDDVEGDGMRVIHPDDRAKVEKHLRELMSGRPHVTEFRAFKGEEVRWIRDDGRPAQEGDPVVRVYGVVRDMTDLKWLETQVLELQRMATINRLVGGVAHEFNNLLTLIMSHAELVRYKLGQDSQLLNVDFDEIIRAARRAADLTHRLLAFSRHRMVLPEVLDLDTLVVDLGEMLQRVVREGIELAVATNSEGGYVKADQGQVEQLLMNLAIHVCDHIPEAGRLALETAGVILDEQQARLMGLSPGPYVKLSVGGDGIAGSIEPPQAADPSGVGLATAYRLAELIGAHIQAVGRADGRVTFNVYLSQVSETEVVEAVRHTRREALAPQTVLVVEDEDRVRRLVSNILQTNGFTVLQASCGEEALDLCRRGQSPIQVAVTDVMLPGMSGPELVERLTEIHPQIGSVFISGYVDVPFAPPDGKPFLRKPFSPADLMRTVYQVTAEQGTGNFTPGGSDQECP